jgi:hypothetical protein
MFGLNKFHLPMIYFRAIAILVFASLFSCRPEEETEFVSQLNLIIDEVKVSIPDDMPNDWGMATSSWEDGERILYMHDLPTQSIIKYSLDKEEILQRMNPFSDTLDPRNIPVALYKLDDGFFMESAYLGFLRMNEEGKLLHRWDTYYQRASRIKNWDYNTKYRIRNSKNSSLSVLDEWMIPIYIELANQGPAVVFNEDLYEHDLIATLDLKEGLLKTFPVRFPEGYLKNGLSYPSISMPAFTAMGKDKIAINFGIDDVIHVLDVNTGEMVRHSVPNPTMPINITKVDLNTFRNREEYAEANYNSFIYGNLFYDPYRDALVRMGVRKVNGESIRLFELIDAEMQIMGQFEFSLNYSVKPLFFPNEIWFSFLQGYKEDTMKLMRVRY